MISLALSPSSVRSLFSRHLPVDRYCSRRDGRAAHQLNARLCTLRVNRSDACDTQLSLADCNREQPSQVTGRRTAGLVSAERRA